eukprot:scaffold97227_cov22-Tisochrysis_lutea.AAC.1
MTAFASELVEAESRWQGRARASPARGGSGWSGRVRVWSVRPRATQGPRGRYARATRCPARGCACYVTSYLHSASRQSVSAGRRVGRITKESG